MKIRLKIIKIIEIGTCTPFPELCGACQYQGYRQGNHICYLFSEMLEESEEHGGYERCEDCYKHEVK